MDIARLSISGPVAGQVGLGVGALGRDQHRASEQAVADRTMVLSLCGIFRLTTHDGHPVDIVGQQQKRLLAILVRSPGSSRSRDQLVDLLWNANKDGYASLRQLRHHLHRRIAPFGAGLRVSGNVVTLTGLREVAPPLGGCHAEFFEDAGFGSESFEDWLRDMRLATVGSIPIPAAFHGTPRFVPHLALSAPIVRGADPKCFILADWFASAMCGAIMANGFATLTDLRCGDRRPETATGIVEIRLHQIGTDAEVTVTALSGNGLGCMTSHHLRFQLANGLPTEHSGLAAFVTTVVAGIERAVARNLRFDLMAWNEAPLYEIVTRMFRLNQSDVLAAAKALDGFESALNPASVLAWRAFALMLLNGERLVARGEAHVAGARDLIAAALDEDPSNPTALAVGAQFSSFIMRDFDRAADLATAALKVAPQSPFARDVHAMLAHYSGKMPLAFHEAQVATSLSLGGPLRHYIAGSVVMTAALAGEHKQAIRTGDEILAARPGFLPVQRHLFVSLAMMGQIGAARALFDTIRRNDPAFGTSQMDAPEYGMLSPESRRLVRQAVKTIGLRAT